jgi:hypothetical protein
MRYFASPNKALRSKDQDWQNIAEVLPGSVAEAEDGGRQGDIQEAQRDGGTGVWDNIFKGLLFRN